MPGVLKYPFEADHLAKSPVRKLSAKCFCKAYATSLFSVNEIRNLEVASDESVRVASFGNLVDDLCFHAVGAHDGICREMECCAV